MSDPQTDTSQVYYSRRYLVPVLRSALRQWIKRDVYPEFRGRIVDAIEGHSDGDHVRVRVENDRDVKLFEYLMCSEVRVP